MYHSISEIPNQVSHPYFQTNTDPTIFRFQMEWLANNGYRSIPLSAIENALGGKNVGGGKLFVITFDDGFRDFRVNALPVLKQFNFAATVFLTTGYVGRRLMDRECLSWNDVRVLQKEGIDFGSHTVSHPKLYDMTRAAIDRELIDSKKVIEDETGKQVNAFSYPYAFPQEDPVFINVFRELLCVRGYTLGVTTRIGRLNAGEDLLSLKRLPMNTHDDVALMKAKLEGMYDWLHGIQYAHRVLKRWL